MYICSHICYKALGFSHTYLFTLFKIILVNVIGQCYKISLFFMFSTPPLGHSFPLDLFHCNILQLKLSICQTDGDHEEMVNGFCAQYFCTVRLNEFMLSKTCAKWLLKICSVPECTGLSQTVIKRHSNLIHTPNMHSGYKFLQYCFLLPWHSLFSTSLPLCVCV